MSGVDNENGPVRLQVSRMQHLGTDFIPEDPAAAWVENLRDTMGISKDLAPQMHWFAEVSDVPSFILHDP
jgi:hypothetical protein